MNEAEISMAIAIMKSDLVLIASSNKCILIQILIGIIGLLEKHVDHPSPGGLS
jgi:hypothetical protein